MSNGEEPGIRVGPLGEPDENPAFSDEDLEGAEAGAGVEVPGITDGEAGHLLGELIGIPFTAAGRLYAGRGPQAVAAQVAEIWPLLPDEADRIGGRVWAAIPARFRDTGRRALEASPALLAIGSIAQAVRIRQAGTQALYQWAANQEETSESQPLTPQPRPSARDAGGGGDRQPGSDGRGLDPPDDAAAGLGLSGVVQSGAAARRERRHLAEAAD